MALFSKHFERYMPSDDKKSWELVSQRTAADDVIFDGATPLTTEISNINAKINGLTFKPITMSSYNALSSKDANTVYFITE